MASNNHDAEPSNFDLMRELGRTSDRLDRIEKCLLGDSSGMVENSLVMRVGVLEGQSRQVRCDIKRRDKIMWGALAGLVTGLAAWISDLLIRKFGGHG